MILLANKQWKCLVILFLLPITAIFAETYYIDALKGNDGASGRDSTAAWRSLDRVNQVTFQPGDTLLFRSGRIYEGQLKPQGSGSEAQTIVVANFGEGYKPRLQGNGLFLATVYLYNVSGWEVTGLDISNNGAVREAGRAGIIVEIRDFGVARSIRLYDLDIHDVNGSLIKKEGGGAGIIVKNGGRETPSWYEGLTIEHCTVKRTHRNGILINGYWSRQDWHPSRKVVIRHNVLEGVPGDGIVPIGCDSALIEWNVMRDCPRLLPDGEAAAGIWPWSCDNTVIQFNEVSDHKAPWDAQGFDSDWNCRNTLIQYNYSHDNEGGFLLVCDDGSASRSSSVGNVGTVVRYNVSINDGGRVTGKHAGFSPVIHLPGPTRNTKIYNNVLIVPVHRHAKADSTLIAFDNWHGYPDSTLLANNIFYALSPVDYEAARATRIFYEHNNYHGEHIARPDDPAAVSGDPLFLTLEKVGHPGMEALKGLLLQAASPVKGQGKPLVGSGVNDLFGRPVLPGQPADIGVSNNLSSNAFAPGQLWPDNKGEHINAHGGSILYRDGVYYWYGEKRGGRQSQGVNVYSSTDLYHWRHEALAMTPLDDPDSDITWGCIMERPKVVYNEKTKQFVMWFHLELKGQGYAAARAGVAVSDSPTGPFRFADSFRPNGNMSRDMGLFVDDDGSAYHIYASNENYDLRIARLTDDYLKPTTQDSLLFREHREAPALFKYRNKYYLFTSACTGWRPNQARLYVADDLFGPWTSLGAPMRGPDADITFDAQSTFVLPVAGKPDAFIFMADRWKPGNLKDSRYIWLPVRFDEDTPYVQWQDMWTLADL